MKEKLILITNGEYSDYSVSGIFKLLTNKTPNELKQKYLKEYPEQCEDYGANFYKFIGWLSSNGYVEDVEYQELHLGAYGCFDDELKLSE